VMSIRTVDGFPVTDCQAALRITAGAARSHDRMLLVSNFPSA
jgi:hypothetical protein